MNKGIYLAGALATALAAIATALPAHAQAPTRIKQHNAWGAYSHNGSNGKICYVLSVPTQKEPADRDHGDVFFMVAKLPLSVMTRMAKSAFSSRRMWPILHLAKEY